MGKISVIVNKDYSNSQGWYVGEMVKDAFVDNGFAVVSDTQPTYANVAREIIVSKVGLPFGFNISVTAGDIDRFALSLVANSVKINFPISVSMRLGGNATYCLCAIHMAYTDNFMVFTAIDYNLNPSTAYPSYNYGCFKVATNEDWDYPHIFTRQTNTFLGSQTFKIDELGAPFSFNVGVSLAYELDYANTIIHPEGKIILMPLYLSYSGITTGGGVDAVIPDGFVSLCKFPSDCPNEFKLDGQDYVRSGRTVFKV